MWNCPAQPAEHVEWGCSYVNSLYKGVYDKYTSLRRGASGSRFELFSCDATVSPAANNSETVLDIGTYGHDGNASLPLGGHKNGTNWLYAYIFPHRYQGKKQMLGATGTHFLTLNGSENALFRVMSDGVVEVQTIADVSLTGVQFR